MSLNDFKTTVTCSLCEWEQDASSANFARLFAMRHWEQRGHEKFFIERTATEEITFPEGLKHRLLANSHKS